MVESNAMIKLMVVDDHDLVRTGIVRMLADQPGVRVIAEAESGEQALQLVQENEPDVVLMDVKMPGMGGLEATRRLVRFSDAIRVVAVTVCEEEPYPSRLLRAGAAGYISKGADIEEMLRAIRVVHAGQRYISSQIAQEMALRPYNTSEQTPLDMLSEREMQIMTMIVNCQKVQDISDKLCLSPKTVNTYRYRIFDKLGVTSDVEMTVVAMRHGMLDSDQAV